MYFAWLTAQEGNDGLHSESGPSGFGVAKPGWSNVTANDGCAGTDADDTKHYQAGPTGGGAGGTGSGGNGPGKAGVGIDLGSLGTCVLSGAAGGDSYLAAREVLAALWASYGLGGGGGAVGYDDGVRI